MINLLNSNSISSVLYLHGVAFYITNSVYSEISKIAIQKEEVDKLIQQNRIQISNHNFNIATLIILNDKYHLGSGETESLAACIDNNGTLCCDDKKARKAANSEMPGDRLIGSLGLLKLAVDNDRIICRDAYFAYKKMLVSGGFLPKNIESDYFCKVV